MPPGELPTGERNECPKCNSYLVQRITMTDGSVRWVLSADDQAKPIDHCPKCGYKLTGTESKPEVRLVCANCHGKNIQSLDWVDANTNEFIGGNESNNIDSDQWCSDCDQNVKFIEETIL